MAVDDIYTVALLHMDGSDASTTFTDESGKTWTARGNAQIDTAQSVFGGAAGLFDGTGDYIDTPDNADWQLDGGADANFWTMDFRVRFNGDPGTATVEFVTQLVDANNLWIFRLLNNTLNFISISATVTIINLSNAWNPATATWYHIAIVKNGTTGYLMFVDGVQIGTTQTDTSPLPNLAATLIIAGRSTVQLTGWMDEVRISKGIARWTADFTPPVVAYGTPSGGFFF